MKLDVFKENKERLVASKDCLWWLRMRLLTKWLAKTIPFLCIIQNIQRLLIGICKTFHNLWRQYTMMSMLTKMLWRQYRILCNFFKKQLKTGKTPATPEVNWPNTCQIEIKDFRALIGQKLIFFASPRDQNILIYPENVHPLKQKWVKNWWSQYWWSQSTAVTQFCWKKLGSN